MEEVLGSTCSIIYKVNEYTLWKCIKQSMIVNPQSSLTSSSVMYVHHILIAVNDPYGILLFIEVRPTSGSYCNILH